MRLVSSPAGAFLLAGSHGLYKPAGDDIERAGRVKEGDLLFKKTGDYLLSYPPAVRSFHCAERVASPAKASAAFFSWSNPVCVTA